MKWVRMSRKMLSETCVNTSELNRLMFFASLFESELSGLVFLATLVEPELSLANFLSNDLSQNPISLLLRWMTVESESKRRVGHNPAWNNRSYLNSGTLCACISLCIKLFFVCTNCWKMGEQNIKGVLTSCTSWEFIMLWKPIILQNFWAMSFKNHWLTSYQNIHSNISFPKAVNKTCPCGVTIFTSHHKVITSSRSLQTRLLHQGVSRLLRHDDADQSQNVSKSADFRCEKNAFLLIGESWE